jgi:hypothetical protein
MTYIKLGNLPAHDMNIDNEIIDCLPFHGGVCITGGLRENDSNLWVRDMNIDNEIIDCLTDHGAVCTTGRITRK